MAVLCESVLREIDGRLSLIRVTDQLQVAGTGKEMRPQPVNLNLVVTFKAGLAHGKYVIRISGTLPNSSTEFVSSEQGVYFEGEDRGVCAVFMLNIVLPGEGVLLV